MDTIEKQVKKMENEVAVMAEKVAAVQLLAQQASVVKKGQTLKQRTDDAADAVIRYTEASAVRTWPT